LLPASALCGTVPKHTSGDTAVARQVVPRLVDFGPGWTAAPASTQQSALTCPGFDPQLAKVVETGAATSDTFRQSPTGPFASASSWVYRTAGQAETVWKTLVGPGVLRCFEQSVRKGATSGVRLTIASAGPATIPKLAPRTAAYRVVATAATSGETVKTYYTLILLGSGREIAEVSLARLAAPVPPQTELLLGRLLVRRM
jgi:hypothetical protein